MIPRCESEALAAPGGVLAGSRDLQLALDASGIGVWSFDLGTGALDCTALNRRICGLPPGAPPPRAEEWLALIHPEDRARVQAAWSACVLQHTPLAVEYRITFPDGSLCWLCSRGAPSVDEDGKLDRVVGTTVDITGSRQITRGRLELRRERVTLAAVVAQALETALPHIERARHQLTVSIPEPPISLDADPVRLAQVLANLLHNAAKYTDEGGHIWLIAEGEEDEVVIRVRDTGIGIPAEHLPTLFEMFSQVRSSSSRSQGGLGIGLSLVRGLVEMHGGSVSARSDGPGRGSEFTVRLPRVPAPPAPQPQGPDAPSASGSAAPRRILVVDDNRDSAESLAQLLRLMGQEVTTAYDGLEGFEAAARLRPDVVLLDIGMPRQDGYATCRLIREQPWGRDMVLIAQTGWGAEGDRQRTEQAGFDAHLVKPVDPQALTEVLRAAGPQPPRPLKSGRRSGL